MEENLIVDKSYIEAFNLGYEVAKELDLKIPMFQNESSDIILKSPIQAGMFQFVQDRPAILGKRLSKSKKALDTNTVKKTFGKNRNRGKGLTP